MRVKIPIRSGCAWELCPESFYTERRPVPGDGTCRVWDDSDDEMLWPGNLETRQWSVCGSYAVIPVLFLSSGNFVIVFSKKALCFRRKRNSKKTYIIRKIALFQLMFLLEFHGYLICLIIKMFISLQTCMTVFFLFLHTFG